MSKLALIFAVFAVVLLSSQANAAPAEEKNCLCPVLLNYLPLCGSDGVTYSNPSEFECAKKCGKTREDVTKLHDGKC